MKSSVMQSYVYFGFNIGTYDFGSGKWQKLCKIIAMSVNKEIQDWAVLQGTLDDKPIFTSYLRGQASIENVQNLPFQIGVAVPLINPTADGLPTQEEAQQLWRIIDVLDEALTSAFEALYVMSITTGGMREFVFYTPKWLPKEIEECIKNIQAQIGDGHELQFMMQEDSDWLTYKKYSNHLSH